MTVISVDMTRPNWFKTQWRTHPDRVWLALILALGFALRIVRLGSRDYWQDEIHNLVKMGHFKEVLQGEYVSNHPPLFTFLGVVWRAVGLGDTEWTMRLLPLILGLASVAAVYVLAKRLFGTRAGLIAAFLVAVSPLHIYHSQDLKVYMTLPFTAPVAVYALWRAVEGNRPVQWLGYALMAAVACYSEFFAGPLLVAVNLWFMWHAWRKWDRWPGWVCANLGGALLFLPYVGVFLSKANGIMVEMTRWWVKKPDLLSVAFFWKAIAFGYSDADPYFKVAMCVFAVAAAAGVLIAWRQTRPAAKMAAMWAVIPVTLVFVLSQIFSSAFLIRSMLPYALPVYMFVAVAVAAIPGKVLRSIGLLGFAALAALPLYERYTDHYPPLEWPHRPGIHPPCQFRAASEFVRSHWEPGDLVIHAGESSWMPFYWYGFKDLDVQRCVSADGALIDHWHKANKRTTDDPTFDGYVYADIQTTVKDRSRVWFVFSGWERSHLTGSPMSAWRWMNAHYPELLHAEFQGVEVYLYQKARWDDGIEAATRDFDCGLGATVKYRGGIMESRFTSQPDWGLYPSSNEERRGSLLLRFYQDVPPEGSVWRSHAPSSSGDARTITFAIENSTTGPVPCRVEVVESDVLISLASLMETMPESDKWRVVRRHNPDPPPTSYELAVAAAGMPDPAGPEAALTGSVRLQPGTYSTLINTFGSPLDATTSRGDVSLVVGDIDVAAPIPRRMSEIQGWHWLTGAPVSVGASTEMPIRITATPLTGAERSYVDLGYLGFVAQPGGAALEAGKVMTQWPGDVEIPGSATQYYTLTLPKNRKRVDVWVFEQAEDGQAYHIFQRWDIHRN